MVYYLIVCRSLTYAQRTASSLERAGISAYIQRTPRSIYGEGCSYSVKISERNFRDALFTLERAGFSPLRVYIVSAEGSYREVML